jgi:tetratricopeptide (TPR) repeat protein
MNNNDKSKAMRRLSNALNANDMESAKKIIENDVKRHLPKYEYYFYLGLVSDDLKEKLKYYSKAIKEEPNFSDAYINRGLVKNELQDYEGSIEDYDKAIELDSKCSLAYNNRGYTKYKKGDYEGALADYNKAILLNPKLKIALDNKAKLLSEVCINDDEEFIAKYYLSLGIQEINKGNLLEGIKNIDESLKHNKKSDVAYFYKAAAYHNLNNVDLAYENYTKAIELNKKMVDAYYNRGQLILKDNPKQALDDFVEAVVLDPKFIDAYYAIAAVQKNLGQYEDAIKNLDKILELEPMAVNAKALKKLILTKYLK